MNEKLEIRSLYTCQPGCTISHSLKEQKRWGLTYPLSMIMHGCGLIDRRIYQKFDPLVSSLHASCALHRPLFFTSKTISKHLVCELWNLLANNTWENTLNGIIFSSFKSTFTLLSYTSTYHCVPAGLPYQRGGSTEGKHLSKSPFGLSSNFKL